MKINLLDSSIYNLISAGEVVENPASVVKELVENSIDAGARNVSVYIEDGGIKSIEVVDDGAGIEKDELPKTILPHATSKIKEADDLATISTLGFRGEALASISAVSEFEICSKYFESEHGARLYAKNGVTELTDCAHAQGTSIRVSNLFYNTPARFKFLSSKATEESAVSKHIFRLILSNPEVAINYYVDGNLTYSSSGEGLKSAVESVFLPKIANSLIEVQDDVTEGIRVSGYISPQEIYKNNRNFQIVILNGRVITDQVLSATIQNAYGTRLMSRCFPIYVLNIVMPFDEVDVNVHPNKKEVRFQNARKVYGHVYRVVMRALEGYELQKRQNLIADFSAKSNENEEKVPLFAPIGEQKDDRGAENKKEMSFEEALSLVRGKSSSFASVSESVSTSFIPKQPTFITLEPIAEEKEEVKETYRETFTPATAPKIEVETMVENEVSTKIFKKVKNYSVIGQFFDTYLAIECEDKVIFIDQHAMHERIIYDRLLLDWESKAVTVQPLMIPYVYENGAEEISLILENASSLLEIGLEVEDFGINSLKVTGVPSLIAEKLDVDGLLTEIAQELKQGKISSVIELGKDKLAQIACKSAIKGGKAFGNEQIELVMDFFNDGNMPLQCPHGRPTAIVYTRKEFEKLFRRRV
ncbi:MAG: DNA mismatch repair endonuclease MutL [Clostridia bacterium]|nr:DNA mismatch repair endonuclease MutL [Clostridia bacterium]